MRHIASGKHDPELLLYAKIAKSQPEEESVAVPRVARLLIVPAPGQAELQAIVLIGDPKAMANGFIAVGNRNRVLLGIGEVNDRRPEYGPEARDLQPAAKPDFFPVLQILQVRTDVAVKPQISRSEEHTSELQSLMRISYAVF